MAISIVDDVTWAGLVGDATLTNGGRIGDLLTIGFAHVVREQSNGRLTQAEAGKIYTSLIPQAFNTALAYVNDRDKLELERIMTHVRVEKEYGYDVSINATDGSLVLGLNNNNGKVDYEKDDILQTTSVKVAQEAEVYAGTVRNDSKQADNELTSAKDRDVKERSMLVGEAKQADNELTSAKSREQTDKQIEVLARQIVGFDDDKRQRVLTTLLNFSSIVGQDHKVPILPNIIATDQGVDELVRLAIRDNSVPYNSTPVAANITVYEIDGGGLVKAGTDYTFNIANSFDLDNKLDFANFRFLNSSGSPITDGFGNFLQAIKGFDSNNIVSGDWSYNSVTRLVTYTSSTNLPPQAILYSISDSAFKESYAAQLSFDLITNKPV